MLVTAENENGDNYHYDGFSGIGAGIDIHKLLRTNGFVSVPFERALSDTAHTTLHRHLASATLKMVPIACM